MSYFTPFRNMDDSYFLIGFDPGELFHGLKFDFRSSYHILGARLMGMTYPDFLLYMAKNYNAQIHGKKGWSRLGFKERRDCQKVCDLLETAWERVVKETDLEQWVKEATS